MLTLNKLLPQGAGLAPVLVKRASHVELDWDARQKSRFDATDSQGRHCGVFLPRGSVVRGGDVLVADDGSLVIVRAAAQPVMRVAPCPQHGGPLDLARAAYHLGNRHVPLEVRADHLKLEPDHVLAAMLRQMQLVVTDAHEAFEPEGGAYAAQPGATHHGHGQGHEHAHEHGHGHGADAAPGPLPATPAPAPAAAAPHVHGPGCAHDHGTPGHSR